MHGETLGGWELEREMSATVAELCRGLEAAFPGAVEGGPLAFRVITPGGIMELEASPGPERVIALLRLPTLRVRIRFATGDRDARSRMLARLDLAMRRGGG
ncbi:MAG: hypothetical protein ACM3ST_07915 [Bdellovibrio bacteriovorus]